MILLVFPLQKLFLVALLNPHRTAHIDEIEQIVSSHERTLPLPKQLEALRRRNQLIQQKACLLKDHYQQLFSGELQQQNVGNCYLIAAFNSIKMSLHCKAILRTSVKRGPNEDYLVGIPLGSSVKTEWIEVTPQDTQIQWYDREGRAALHPVKASLGWKVLEAAYIKLATGAKAIRRERIEGGLGHEALQKLFGESVMSDLLGEFGDHSLASQGKTQDLESWFRKFSNGTDMATVNSRYVAGKTDKDSYTVRTASQGEVKMHYNHSYSVSDVNRIQKRVTVVNPHNTGQPIIFTFAEFAEAFTQICSVRVDARKIFQ